MAHLYVSWHGAKWRDYPQPTLASGEPPVERDGEAWTRPDARLAVLACVGDEYETVYTVIARTGLSDRRVRTYLRDGVESGVLERMERPHRFKGGKPLFLYRRRQAVAA